MLYLGIDPGLSGSLAWIKSQNTVVDARRFKDVTEKELSVLICELKTMNTNVVAIIEHVHAFPKQGVSSVWKFADQNGMVRGLLIAHQIPFKLVSPMKWMGWYNMKRDKAETKSAWKRRLRGKAQELFPTATVNAENADAILIAEYCRKCF